MKRLLLILLAAALLTACGGKNPPPPATEATQLPVDVTNAIYVQGSAVEQQTGGAVWAYGLENETYFGLYTMGSHVLLVHQKGLTVLTGQYGEKTATFATEELRPNSVIDIAPTGFAYYSPNSRTVTVLNPQLQQVSQTELPKEIVGDPQISIARNEVYYSIGNELRALSMTTGISRLLRQQSTGTLTLLGVYFSGTDLLIQITDELGGTETEFISTQTGQTLSLEPKPAVLLTTGDAYYASYQDGIVQQTAFGTRNGAHYGLQVPHPTDRGGRALLPHTDGAVDYVATESGLELTYYDLTTGKCTAKTTLPNVHSPFAFCSDSTGVWMLATDGEKTCHALYRWDVTKLPLDDDTVYTGPLYTPENPDTEGLAQCAELANGYQKQYGIKLLFWKDAVKHTGGYTLTPEHNPQVITGMLEKLQPVLAQFPESFLLKTVEAGWVQVALVRQIEGDRDYVQFWEDGDCWIIISAKADVADALLQTLGYGVDSHVLGNSRDFDTWNDLNPSDFAYPYSNKVDEKSAYLTGPNRAFTDAQAMSYPHEDRCRVFYHAMKADNAEMFASPILQAKLLRMCEGIREAYKLEKKTDIYLWEQYLKTPIAYIPE